ncbi:MAG: arsenate reductase family protein [Elusimicrobiota bacterium]|nr:arsenate reductase family protein [Elusimicrobiota bacterium]
MGNLPWRVYEYAKCSTCRKALKFLDARGIPYERVPIVDQPPTRAELEAMLARGVELKRLFNTSGELYRELGLSAKLKTMSRDQALSLLAKNGKLVKRPFVLLKDRGLVGFDEAAWKAAAA